MNSGCCDKDRKLMAYTASAPGALSSTLTWFSIVTSQSTETGNWRLCHGRLAHSTTVKKRLDGERTQKLSPWRPSRTLGSSSHVFFDCWSSKNSVNTSLSSDFLINSSTGYCVRAPETFRVSQLFIGHPLNRTCQLIVEHLDNCPIYLILLIWFNIVEIKKKKKSTWRRTSKELKSLSNYKACCLVVQILVGLACVSANLLF